MKKILASLAFLAVVGAPLLAACSGPAAADLPPLYYSPLKDARYVSAGTSIIVRYGRLLTPTDASSIRFDITGSTSGTHRGHATLADDQQTVVCSPEVAFAPGERVQVKVTSPALNLEGRFQPLTYSFDVASNQQAGGIPAGPPPANPPTSAFPKFLTVPQDIPHFAMSRAARSDSSEGDIFVAPFYWTGSTIGSYLLILSPQGQLIYYQSMARDLAGFDFKVQPTGTLSYFSQKDAAF